MIKEWLKTNSKLVKVVRRVLICLKIRKMQDQKIDSREISNNKNQTKKNYNLDKLNLNFKKKPRYMTALFQINRLMKKEKIYWQILNRKDGINKIKRKLNLNNLKMS